MTKEEITMLISAIDTLSDEDLRGSLPDFPEEKKFAPLTKTEYATLRPFLSFTRKCEYNIGTVKLVSQSWHCAHFTVEDSENDNIVWVSILDKDINILCEVIELALMHERLGKHIKLTRYFKEEH